MANVIRIRFSKTGPLRFIGHLDFGRVFRQTIRRAKLPVAYSQGFNPHILLSFALPLPLGMASLNDYADLTFENDIPLAEIQEKLNNNAPNGLTISKVYPIEGQRGAAAAIAADYALHFNIPPETINNILTAETLIVPKKTKSGIKDTDIRQDIINIWQYEAEIPYTTLRLSAGSSRFLNPLIVAELLLNEKPCISTLTRIELYQSGGNEGLNPL